MVYIHRGNYVNLRITRSLVSHRHWCVLTSQVVSDRLRVCLLVCLSVCRPACLSVSLSCMCVSRHQNVLERCAIKSNKVSDDGVRVSEVQMSTLHYTGPGTTDWSLSDISSVIPPSQPARAPTQRLLTENVSIATGRQTGGWAGRQAGRRVGRKADRHTRHQHRRVCL